MEWFSKRLLFFLPAFAAVGFAAACFGGDGILLAAFVTGLVSIIPTRWALERWLGRQASNGLTWLQLIAGSVSVLLLNTGLWEDVALVAIFANVAVGVHAAARIIFRRWPPRLIASVATIFAIAVLLETVLARGEALEFGPSSLGIVIGASLSGLAAEFVLSRHANYLPAPAQVMSAALILVSLVGGVSVFAVNLPAVTFAGLLAVGLAYIYGLIYYDFDDIVVFVDEEGNVTGTGRKLESHNAATVLHRAFSVFLFNPDGEVLLQQRAFSKKTWPGAWSNSCCGHVMLHETTEEAARRRLRYELGLTGVELSVALPDFRYRAEKDGVVENEICPVLVGFVDEQPRPRPSEVANVRWTPWSEFVEYVNDPASGISPWAVEEVELLTKNEEFRAEFERRTNVAQGLIGQAGLHIKEAA